MERGAPFPSLFRAPRWCIAAIDEGEARVTHFNTTQAV
jgi:hypothetical protein